MSGWYRMHRGWMDHPVFLGEVFSRRDAFQWLIQEAAFGDVEVRLPGGIVTLHRGQISHSIRFMAKAWKWDEKRVRRFLAAVQDAKIIASEAAAGQTVITICNYEKYQTSENKAAAVVAAATPQPRRGGAAKNKNEERKEEERRAADFPDEGRYAFAGRTIRLNETDFQKWKATYHGIPDLTAELTGIDGWFEDRPEPERKRWFRSVPGMLNRKHQEALVDRI